MNVQIKVKVASERKIKEYSTKTSQLSGKEVFILQLPQKHDDRSAIYNS